jgi:hypothetical protein
MEKGPQTPDDSNVQTERVDEMLDETTDAFSALMTSTESSVRFDRSLLVLLLDGLCS